MDKIKAIKICENTFCGFVEFDSESEMKIFSNGFMAAIREYSGIGGVYTRASLAELEFGDNSQYFFNEIVLIKKHLPD